MDVYSKVWSSPWRDVSSRSLRGEGLSRENGSSKSRPLLHSMESILRRSTMLKGHWGRAHIQNRKTVTSGSPRVPSRLVFVTGSRDLANELIRLSFRHSESPCSRRITQLSPTACTPAGESLGGVLLTLEIRCPG